MGGSAGGGGAGATGGSAGGGGAGGTGGGGGSAGSGGSGGATSGLFRLRFSDFWWVPPVTSATATPNGGLLLLRFDPQGPSYFVEVTSAGVATSGPAFGSGLSVEFSALLRRPLGGYFLVFQSPSSFLVTSVAALDANLQVEWAKSYDTSVSRVAAVTSDGGLVLTSKQAAPSLPTIYKLTSLGVPSWAVQYQSDAVPVSVVEAADGGIWVALAGPKLELLVLDAQGKKAFSKQLSVQASGAALGAISSGVLLAAGSSAGLLTSAFDSAGNASASQLYAGAAFEKPALTPLPSGGFLLRGAGVNALHWGKLSATGILSATRTLLETTSPALSAAASGADGSFLFGSEGYDFEPFFLVTKIAADGSSCPASQAVAPPPAQSVAVTSSNGAALSVVSVTASSLSVSTTPKSGSVGKQVCY